jgi:hypothetical protein
MEATVKKVGGYTRDQIVNNPITNGIQIIAKREEGIEIVDRRSLSDRFKNSIKGRGVKRCFGTTHFVVTESYYKKLIN